MTEPAKPEQKIGSIMFVLGWLVFFAMLAWFFDDLLLQQENPNQRPETSDASQLREVILKPNRGHHYVVSGLINNQPVTFLLDTGATDVVIPAGLADKLKLRRGAEQIANTANGQVRVYSTQLQSLSIGAIKLDNIRASINPGMSDSTVLLGMSALKQIEFAQRGDNLILRQYLY